MANLESQGSLDFKFLVQYDQLTLIFNVTITIVIVVHQKELNQNLASPFISFNNSGFSFYFYLFSVCVPHVL